MSYKEKNWKSTADAYNKGDDKKVSNRLRGMSLASRKLAAAAPLPMRKEEVELDEAATRKEVKKVYSKKGNHIGTIYHVDNGKDKPFISAHYHPGGFMNNSLSLKSHEDAEKWIHHSHSSHLEQAKARHDEAKLELRQHEKHLKSIPESVEQVNEIRGLGGYDSYDHQVDRQDLSAARKYTDKLQAKLDAIQKPKSQAAHTKALKGMSKTPVAKFLKTRKGGGTVRTEEVEQIDEIGPAAVPAAGAAALAGAGALALRVAAPMIARAGAAQIGRLGARAGITAAKKLGTSTMGAGRLGSKIGSQVGQQAIQSGVSSMADRLAAIRARQQQQANEDVAISADRKDDKDKGKYLGTKKGKTMTGERANPVNTNPEIRMPEQGRSAVDK